MRVFVLDLNSQLIYVSGMFILAHLKHWSC